MKMRNLLFGVILGLLAVAYSTPVDNVTQIPANPDDDILREVLEDGYLVDEMTPHVLTTNPPRIHTTVQASRQPTSDSKNSEVEGSAEANAELTITPMPKEDDADVINTTQSENPTSAEKAGDSRSVSATTQSSQPEFISSSFPINTTQSVDSTSTDKAGDSSSVLAVTQSSQPEFISSSIPISTTQSVNSTSAEKAGDSSSVLAVTQSSQPEFISSSFPINTTQSVDSTSTDKAGDASSVSAVTQSSQPEFISSSIPINTTQSVNSTSTEKAGDSSSVLVTTQSSHPELISSSIPPEAPSTPSFTNRTNDIEDFSGDLMGNGRYGSGSGSGSGDIQSFVTIASKTTSSDTKKSTESSSFPVFEDLAEESEPGEGSEEESESDVASKSVKESDKSSDKESDKPLDTESEKPSDTESSTRSGSKKSRMFDGFMTEMATQKQGHADKVILNDHTPTTNAQQGRTPGWIIIVAFIVGLAALVMLCVAIATRDKWNGPPKSSQQGTKTSSSDEQREQEMTTFVSKESPRENGKAAEYTVIPLDELPENYSSH